jgi:CRP/FNR family transcriptional regulator, nitrogen fixation regulation protein
METLMTQLAFSVVHAASTARDTLAGGPSSKSPTDGRRDSAGGLRAIGPVLHFAQDRDIYDEGDDADVFFKVASGVVRTCKFLSDGRRQIDSFHVAGDVFGLEAGSEHSLCAEAVCDCTVISYRRRGLETLAASDESLSRQLLSYAMRSLERAREHSLLLGRRSAVERVAAFLIEWAEHTPESEIISLAMTRQDIADYLGLTMETVSRTLSQLERDALIELPTARQVQVKNLTALRNLNS